MRTRANGAGSNSVSAHARDRRGAPLRTPAAAARAAATSAHGEELRQAEDAVDDPRALSTRRGGRGVSGSSSGGQLRQSFERGEVLVVVRRRGRNRSRAGPQAARPRVSASGSRLRRSASGTAMPSGGQAGALHFAQLGGIARRRRSRRGLVAKSQCEAQHLAAARAAGARLAAAVEPDALRHRHEVGDVGQLVEALGHRERHRRRHAAVGIRTARLGDAPADPLKNNRPETIHNFDPFPESPKFASCEKAERNELARKFFYPVEFSCIRESALC